MTQIIIRKMTEQDIPQVAEIEKLSFSIPWSEQAFSESLQLPHAIFLVVEQEEKILGYCGLYKVFGQGDITNIAVHPDYRARGVGKAVLKKLLQICDEEEVLDVTLEVRESNTPAIALYQALGFENIGVRKNFYEKPCENAIIMCRHG